MSAQRRVPVTVTHEELLRVLDDIRKRVAEGDSFEGSLEYLIPEDESADAHCFDLMAAYRIGNSTGQGGLRMVGKFADVPPVQDVPDWRAMREWLIKTRADAVTLARGGGPGTRLGFDAQAEVLSSALDFMDERERAR